jgi:SAM-dependent methyltransferase
MSGPHATACVRADHWVHGLACPACGASIRQSAQRLACSACPRAWPMVDGVPHFVENFPYWGEMPQELMREVNRRAAKGSWKTALLEFDDPVVRKASEMILNLDRANWHWLVNLPAESRVLDLGAGTGTNAHGLGMHYRDVIALEPVLERIEFMTSRFSQEGLSHVKPLRSSLWVLPFSPDSFDLVAMNGVLEWVATGRTEDPKELQKQALRNVYRLLRPDGYFYLGIENRYSLGYFVGYPDPHCGLPWVTVLPRRCAHWYARRRGHAEGYRNYLYSSRGYQRLLESVGFNRIEIYVALPSYNHPRFLIPLADHVFNYYARNFTGVRQGWKRRFGLEAIRKLGLLKHCEYSFVILARK